MKEQKISFETAKLAKEKGFNLWCEKQYVETLEHTLDCGRGDVITFPYQYPRVIITGKLTEWDINYGFAPTQSLLQKWLREEYNCIVEVVFQYSVAYTGGKIKYFSTVDYYGKDMENAITEDADFRSKLYNTFEEALEVGLQEALKLI